MEAKKNIDAIPTPKKKEIETLEEWEIRTGKVKGPTFGAKVRKALKDKNTQEAIATVGVSLVSLLAASKKPKITREQMLDAYSLLPDPAHYSPLSLNPDSVRSNSSGSAMGEENYKFKDILKDKFIRKLGSSYDRSSGEGGSALGRGFRSGR